ncbi:cyclic-di-AMP-binding protein CbpB [Mesobacillus harenae]|uniref:cyclic-di-AMP-binding protein CbpB n=1 Tax=Mesobacillus harenae TaxID=2213203 RepID=UPI0015809C8E|nr:cyclic-di-AMP-binding protein CbpB [Mesobacillus harenae]
MISLHSGEFLEMNVQELMIPSERVAHVQLGNNLEHALLVLTKSGYTAIPVLDVHYRLQGLISTPIVMDAILGLQRIEFDQLDQKKVEEAMNSSIPRLKANSTVQSSLALLIDHPFLCIEDDEEVFVGILTRRTVLQLLNNNVRRFKK